MGLARAGQSNADPSLNVDVNRDGIEPDIAFTGANDSVPWVVWYETGTGTPGLASNEMVFAAKAEADAGGLGGFHWHVIGNCAATGSSTAPPVAPPPWPPSRRAR